MVIKMQIQKIDNAESLLNFINHDLLLNKSIEENITPDTDLIASGVIDSLSLIQLVTHLERQNKIEIHDVDVNPENFQSVNTILNYLRRLTPSENTK